MEERDRFFKGNLTPKEFKKEWNPYLECWLDYTLPINNNTNLNSLTKEFLRNGFPKELYSIFTFNSRFTTLSEKLFDPSIDKYLIFGYNYSYPICIDTNNNDRIVLIDTLNDYGSVSRSESVIDQSVSIINTNIIEFSASILECKYYLQLIDYNFEDSSEKQKNDLLNRLRLINPNIFNETDYWHDMIINNEWLQA